MSRRFQRYALGRLVPVLVGMLCLVAVAARGDSDALLRSLRPTGYVTDRVGVLGASDKRALEAMLSELDRKTGAQVAVVVLASMEGGQIDDFAVRLYERWGIGQKGQDRGALLLAALNDRRVRIEVGYGLEGILPDARTGRLIDEHILPAFRADNHGEGIARGTVALASVIAADAGVSLGDAPVMRPREQPESRGIGFIHILLLIILIPVVIRHPWLLLFLLSSGRGGGGRVGGFGGGFGGFGGGLSGGGGASRGW